MQVKSSATNFNTSHKALNDPKVNLWTVMPRDLKFFLVAETLLIAWELYQEHISWKEIPTKIGVDFGVHQIALALSKL